MKSTARTLLLIGTLVLPGMTLLAQVNQYRGSGNYDALANWSLGAVPSGDEEAHIVSGNQNVIYDNPSDHKTTNRILVGYEGLSQATLTLKGDAETLSFGGNDHSAANYFGVDGGQGTLNIFAGIFQTIGPASLRIGSNGPNSKGFLNITQEGKLDNAYRTYIGAGESNAGTMRVDGGKVNIGKVDGGGLYIGRDGGFGSTEFVNGATVRVRGNVLVGTGIASSGSEGSITLRGTRSVLDQHMGGMILLGGNSSNNQGKLIVANGAVLHALGMAMNAGGGQGHFATDGTSTVRFKDNVLLQGSAEGSGFQHETGEGVIHLTITDAKFIAVNVGGKLALNSGIKENIDTWNPSSTGGSQLKLSIQGIPPRVGQKFSLIQYSSLTGSQFQQGERVKTKDGYVFSIDYGSGKRDAITATLVKAP